MGKSDLLKDSMKSGLDGLLSSTKKSPQKKEATPLKTEKEPAVHCNFVIDKSVHTRMKFLAIEKNMSLRDIVNEAMKEYLEKTVSEDMFLASRSFKSVTSVSTLCQYVLLHISH